MSEIEPYEEEKYDEEDQEPDWAQDPKRMGFLDHLEELRWTLMKPLLVFFIAFIGAMIFIKDVKNILLRPLLVNLDENDPVAIDGLTTMNVTGVFFAILAIGLIIGAMVASPFFVYHLARFLAPALTTKEKKILVPGAIAVLILFLAGGAFGYFFLVPQTIYFTIVFNEMMGFNMLWTTGPYFGFLIWTIIGLGIGFEMPLAILVLVHMGAIDVNTLIKFRRLMIMIIIITAAMLTPPEPITQLSLAVPLWLLYEISIIIARFLQKKSED